MRYLTRFALIISSLIVFFGAAAVTTADAQKRHIHRRPIIIRHYDPFWRGTLWDPWWPYGQYNDPYYWERRERYYDRKDVRDAEKKLRKDREKALKDGVIDAKEAEKLAKDQRKYNEEVADLND
jgi:hypothetical protein